MYGIQQAGIQKEVLTWAPPDFIQLILLLLYCNTYIYLSRWWYLSKLRTIFLSLNPSHTRFISILYSLSQLYPSYLYFLSVSLLLILSYKSSNLVNKQIGQTLLLDLFIGLLISHIMGFRQPSGRGIYKTGNISILLLSQSLSSPLSFFSLPLPLFKTIIHI